MVKWPHVLFESVNLTKIMVKVTTLADWGTVQTLCYKMALIVREIITTSNTCEQRPHMRLKVFTVLHFTKWCISFGLAWINFPCHFYWAEIEIGW